jgi:hypothetical protein
MLGFKSFDAAQSTLAGIELIHMLKKRQLEGEELAGRSVADSSTVWPHNPLPGRANSLPNRQRTKIYDRTPDRRSAHANGLGSARSAHSRDQELEALYTLPKSVIAISLPG